MALGFVTADSVSQLAKSRARAALSATPVFVLAGYW